MTEVLTIGRQRATLLDQLTARLIELETDVTILYPAGHERHDRAQADYDALALQVTTLAGDATIAAFRAAEALRILTEKQDALDKALATCESELAAADAALSKAQDAVDALQARQTQLIRDRQALG